MLLRRAPGLFTALHCGLRWLQARRGPAASPRSRLVALAATAALTSETWAEGRDVGHQGQPQPQSHCPVELPTQCQRSGLTALHTYWAETSSV